MSDNQEQNSSANPDARVAFALSRLGITLDADNGMDTDRYVDGLNAAADKIEQCEEDRELIASHLAEVGYPIDQDRDLLTQVSAALTALQAACANVADLEKKLASQKSQTSKAKKAAAVAEAAAPESPRDIGPLKSQPSGRDLLEKIQDADQVELAFSDGNGEIVDLKPRVISAEHFDLLGSDRVRLNVPELRVFGPRTGDQPYGLAGYGLLLDGKQVAWAGRPEQLTIAAGTQHELKDDVVFGAIDA